MVNSTLIVQLLSPGANGKFRQFDARVHVEFVQDAFTMAGNGLGTEGELLPNLLIIRPICHQFRHLALAHAEHIQPNNIALSRGRCVLTRH